MLHGLLLAELAVFKSRSPILENNLKNVSDAMENEIDLRALKQVTNAILDHIINDLGIEKFAIKGDQDFYWEVPSDQLHTVKKEQPQLDMGRLSDDWEFLAPIIDDKNQAIALMLIHLAPLIRCLGEEVGQ